MTTFRADFKFCGYYNGKDMPAVKWLKKLDWELEGYMVDGKIPPHRYIQAFELLLTEDAATWAETHPQAVSILNSDDPSEKSVKDFRSLLCARFPMKSSEVSSISFDTELSELKQHDESLAAYYKRLTVLMQHVGARDRPSQPTDANPPLSMLEAAMLESIMKAFLRGLSDPDVRREATRGLASPERSLAGIYNLADEARRTKSAVQKLDEEERKTRENEILRTLVQKTMSKDQLDNLVASFHTSAGSQQPSWSLDGLSKMLDKLSQTNVSQTNVSRSNENQPPSRNNYPNSYYPSQRPPDRYEQAPYIAQNPNRRNGSGPDNRDVALRKPPANNNYRNPQRDLPDKSKSLNPFINGSKPYSMRADGPMCVRCGELNAKRDDGHKCIPLPAWEQSYLRELVFGTPAQSNFAAAGFGEFDGRASPWSHSQTSDGSGRSFSSDSGVDTPSTGSFVSQANSITIGVSELYQQPRAQSSAAEACYDETSGPNKRPRVEDAGSDGPSQTRADQAPPHGQPAPAAGPAQQPPMTFQAADPRPKNKGKRRVGKKIELQPLVGLFNEGSGAFDSPVSVRAMLQHTKVDMSWMDLVAWSPAIGRELKRLCTRVTKKREKKPKPGAPLHQLNPQFNPMFNQQYASVPPWVHPSGVPQAFHPYPPNVAPNSSSAPGGASVGAVQTLPQPDAHTKHLSTLTGVEKAFRIPGTVRCGDGSNVGLERKEAQADQGSEINVISTSMVHKVKAHLRPLAEIGFEGLTMQTADHNESMLKHYVGFDFCAEGIWRFVRCFVSPETRGRPDEPRILLGLPWLHSVNAFISVRQSTIQIGDPSIGESVRHITGPELVYHKDHNMIMYPKAIIRPMGTITSLDDGDSDSSSDESEDDLSDVDDAAF